MRFLGIIGWLLESSERKKYEGLPRRCRHCEALGICRRPKEKGWKCYRGCRMMEERKSK